MTSWRSNGNAMTHFPGTGRSNSISHPQQNELPSAISNMLEREYKAPQNLLEAEVLAGKKEDNLLSDTYLPVLRNFATTQRVRVPPADEVISKYKKAQANEKARAHVPKLIDCEAINRRTESSLYERQRDILVHAQMQKPANKSQKKTMKETQFKDWVMNEIEGKIKAKESLASKNKNQDQANNFKSERVERSKYSDN